MAFSNLGSIWSANNKTAGTTLTGTLSQGANAGDFVVIALALDNTATVDGDNNEVTWLKANLNGQPFNCYKLGEYTNSNAAAGGGATVSVWGIELTTAAITTDNFTVTFPNSITAKAGSAWRFGKSAGTHVTAVDLATLVNDAAVPGSMTLTEGASAERLWFRATALETNSTTATTPTTGWTAITTAGTSGGGSATNMRVSGEFIIATSASETSAPTLPSCDNASVFIALQEVTPPSAYIAADVAPVESTATATYTLPTSPQAPAAGDILLCLAVVDAASATMPTFTVTGSGQAMTQLGANDAVGTGATAGVFWHTMTAADVTTGTVSISGINTAVGNAFGFAIYRGGNTVTRKNIGTHGASTTTLTITGYAQGSGQAVALLTERINGGNISTNILAQDPFAPQLNNSFTGAGTQAGFTFRLFDAAAAVKAQSYTWSELEGAVYGYGVGYILDISQSGNIVSGDGTAAMSLGGSGTGASTAAGAGTAAVTIGEAGVGASTAASSGTAAVTVGAPGGGTGIHPTSGAAAITIGEAGVGTGVHPSSGAAAVTLGATGDGVPISVVPSSGLAAISLAGAAQGAATAASAGVAATTLAGTASGASTAASAGSAAITTTAAGTGAATAAGAGDAPVAFSGSAQATAIKPATGDAALTLGAAGQGASFAAAAGNALITFTASGANGSGGVAAGDGLASMSLGAAGQGAANVAGAGDAAMSLGATGGGAKTVAVSGLAAISLAGVGAGAVIHWGAGLAAINLGAAAPGASVIASSGLASLSVLATGQGLGAITVEGAGLAAITLGGFGVGALGGLKTPDWILSGAGSQVSISGQGANVSITGQGSKASITGEGPDVSITGKSSKSVTNGHP